MKSPDLPRRGANTAARPAGTRPALGIFALLVTAGPLLFGAGDRLVQVMLAALLALGVFLLPPAIVPLSKWGNRLAIVILALLVAKELAPAEWFGTTVWRTAVTQDFSLDLPRTHHPEPARALDAWLGVAVGAVWFLWVRRLAADRADRIVLAWTLFASAALLSAVSFATRGWDSQAIYGLRFTQSWHGFGPFPNRNHTANFLAMGAILGCGCLTWAGARKRWLSLLGGALLLGLVVIALLTTESRGGLLALGLGLLVYCAFMVLRMRSRRALPLIAGVALILCGLVLAFGAPVLARFQTEHSALAMDPKRLEIWKDADTMWKDAPLLGHGVATFRQTFPFYQTFWAANSIILHPESSWRQWLIELGLVPVALALVALAGFLASHLRETLQGSSGFYFRSAGFAAAAALLAHSAVDVPAHRWGTAGIALAALAIACPMRLEAGRIFARRKAALVPLAVAVFWTLPFFFDAPAWSPLTLNRVLARDALAADVSLHQLTALSRQFPLSAELNQNLGLRELAVLGRNSPSSWQRHFDIAARLLPGSEALPIVQARAVAPLSPGLAIGYWKEAIARGGDGAFVRAVRETAGVPMAAAVWGSYAEAHPHLLLAYAEMLPGEGGRPFAERWWQRRALTAVPNPREVAAFYRVARRWSTRAQFGEWMQHRAGWRKRDHREWALLLQQWGDAAGAWRLLEEFTPELDFPTLPPASPREPLEVAWRTDPEDLLSAQQFAAVLFRDGETKEGEEIILAVGARAGAPWWFVQKAAHILARRGRFGEAVTLLLRTTPPRSGR